MKNGIKGLLMIVFIVLFFNCSKDEENNIPIEVVKTKYKITSVTITQMPFLNSNGFLWDGINGPDVFLALVINNSIVNYTSPLINISNADIPLPWNLTTPYQSSDFNSPVYIHVMDNDVNDFPSTSNQTIGIVSFYMLEYTVGATKYPSTVTKTINGVTVKLNLTWE
ncbi:MAG: hypothetical protein KA210_00620 [Bacteroidia bacterium]|nr:hypothetical protein [Bacteroidia bacterium]